MNKRKILVIGGGGHSLTLIDAIKESGHQVFGVIDNDPKKLNKKLLGVEVLGNDEFLKALPPENFILVNGIGSTKISPLRKEVFLKFKSLGFSFLNVIHPTAVISEYAELKEGVQVLAGTIVGPCVKINENVILNNRTIIEHDCIIGEHTHVSPGAILCGGVNVGNCSHIGVGSIVIQELKIGSGVLVAAGAVVIKNIENGMFVKGVPAR